LWRLHTLEKQVGDAPILCAFQRGDLERNKVRPWYRCHCPLFRRRICRRCVHLRRQEKGEALQLRASWRARDAQSSPAGGLQPATYIIVSGFASTAGATATSLQWTKLYLVLVLFAGLENLPAHLQALAAPRGVHLEHSDPLAGALQTLGAAEDLRHQRGAASGVIMNPMMLRHLDVDLVDDKGCLFVAGQHFSVLLDCQAALDVGHGMRRDLLFLCHGLRVAIFV
jgi:hypothetical protein